MREVVMVALGLGLGLGLCVACSSDKSDKSVAGPGISVHCAAQTAKRLAATPPAVGDTSVRVSCPPTL